MILTTNMKPPEIKIIPQETEDYKYDFKNIKGQIQARKASEIAAAGMHNMLMSGSRKIHYSKNNAIHTS